MVFENPSCPACGNRLLRWSWFERTGEKPVYFYCLECDKAGMEPCILVYDISQLTERK